MRSNDLFERANQRAVGLIGRVRKRNSPFGRAQRGRTGFSAGGFADPLQKNVMLSSAKSVPLKNDRSTAIRT